MAYKPTYKYNVVRTDPPMITKDGETFEKVEDIWYNSYQEEESCNYYINITQLTDILNNFASKHDIADLLTIKSDYNYGDNEYIFSFHVKDKIEDINIINRLEKELKTTIDKENEKNKKDREKLFLKLKKEFEGEK